MSGERMTDRSPPRLQAVERDFRAPEFPERFEKPQMEALRVLLLTAFGVAGGWKYITDLVNEALHIDQEALKAFAREGGHLGFPKNRNRIEHIYNVVHVYLKSHPLSIWDNLDPIHSQVYHKLESPKEEPESEPELGWEILDRRSAKTRAEQLEENIARYEGVYFLYRYGTDEEDGGEIIRAAVHIYPSKNRDRILFAGCYPSSVESGTTNTPTIFGNVESLTDYIYLLGCDDANNTPYIMALYKIAGRKKVTQTTNGLMLRRTRKGPLIAARVYVERTNEQWDDACGKAEKISTNIFKDENADKFDIMKAVIDNKVDGAETFILRTYERKARGR